MIECWLSTHKAHRVGNNVVFGHFSNFGRRSVIRDKHKRLAEHSWMTLDDFLVSRGWVRAGPTAMRDISGDSDQERRGLTACLNDKKSCQSIALLRRGVPLTWNRVAVEGLHFVLCLWHLRYNITHALRTLVWVSIPAHGRVRTIEIRQVIHAR